MSNKYSQTPEDKLDLHGYTCSEAQSAILEFLEKNKKADYNIVRIIVGKGLHSENGPVLGSFARDFLEKQGYDFRNAKVSEGSEGAIDIKL